MTPTLGKPYLREEATTHQEYWSIYGKQCEIIIEQRPTYCDRGNWIAKIFPTLDLSIDEQDMWPRYYMDFDRATLEIHDWLKKRNQL